MPKHVDVGFSQLHFSKLKSGADASKGTPDGDGDAYWATDTDTLYIGDGGAWVEVSGGGGGGGVPDDFGQYILTIGGETATNENGAPYWIMP
jgi:hypothetical protein